MIFKYKEYKPRGFLSHFVHCFWMYENTGERITHTILPHGHLELMAEITNKNFVKIRQTGVCTRSLDLVISRKAMIFSIRLKLPAVEYLIALPIRTIHNQIISLPDDYWDLNKYQNSTFEEFVRGVSLQLRSALRHSPIHTFDSRKLKLFDLVYTKKISTVEKLAAESGWSSRQINRYFSQQYGFALKEYLKIIRLSTTYKSVSTGALFPSVLYFDQSHFIKDFKRYTGMTPRELYQNKNDRFLQLLAHQYS